MNLKELIDKGKTRYTFEEGILLFNELLRDKSTLYKGLLYKSNGDESKRCINWTSSPIGMPKRFFGDVFAEYLLKNDILVYAQEANNTNYNGRDNRQWLHKDEIETFKNYKSYWEKPSVKDGKPKRMDEDKMCHCLFHAKNISGFTSVDYQVPLIDGGANNIDYMMSKDGNLYICEVKKFKSKETLLRCVLEITTYFQQLNNEQFEKVYGSYNKIQKTILVPIDSEAYNEYRKIDDYPNLKRLMKELDVIVYGLDYSVDNNHFTIKEK